jgi:RluA family pseudouridine synthase
LHLDDAVVAVNKPPRVLASPEPGGETSVPELLRTRPELSQGPGLRVVHHLDRDASGVVIYARTLAAQQHLAAQFADRRIESVYLALVTGYVPQDGEIDLKLAFGRRHSRVVPMAVGGKPALTRFSIAQRLAGHTLLECRPLTDRPDQIRAHLAAIGHPLAVDPVYGSSEGILLSRFKPDYRPSRRRQERPLIDRLTLHASRITFEHPLTGTPLTMEAQFPKDFRAAVGQLARLALD